MPRLPLEASIDLTYRCNNRCRHCWLWLAENASEGETELSFGQWREIVDQARALGTRQWSISGGEPMLRPDFEDVFDYVTRKATVYTLNTNGTLITPEIARLLERKGNKLVAVYGATAEVYDRVTRNPGGFEAMVRGLAYLKEAGTGFIVQLIPMRDNWHQWQQMIEFAQSWSEQYRMGAPWLYKSACGDEARNAEIERQRLNPADAVNLDKPYPSCGDETDPVGFRDDCVYAKCIEGRRKFHVDPYGSMSFCCFVKDPALRHDLVDGQKRVVQRDAVRTAWEDLIPALGGKVSGGQEYAEGCGVCDLRAHCRWCDVYGYLEHRRHGAKVDYLCAVARETRRFREGWAKDHIQYYEIAGVTVKVESDLPVTDATFNRKFESFRVEGPGDDMIVLRHHFGVPELDGHDFGKEVYRYPPWAVYRKRETWVYQSISPDENDLSSYRVAVFNADHTRGEIYNDELQKQGWLEGDRSSLTLFPSDQIVLARVLADRGGCFLHSGGLKIDGQGFVFVGHSEAGKSTTMELVRRKLGERVEILCDDRNVVRFWPGGFRGGLPGFYVHGTWSHGDVPDVSSASAPLLAILFLEQSERNEIIPLGDRKLIWQRLLATLIKPQVSADWWNKEMDLLEQIVAEVPCYTMRFDKSGEIVAELERLIP